jgi:hypothetical protein
VNNSKILGINDSEMEKIPDKQIQYCDYVMTNKIKEDINKYLDMFKRDTNK